MKSFMIMWVLSFLAGITIWGGIIYIALHFIMKLW